MDIIDTCQVGTDILRNNAKTWMAIQPTIDLCKLRGLSAPFFDTLDHLETGGMHFTSGGVEECIIDLPLRCIFRSRVHVTLQLG